MITVNPSPEVAKRQRMERAIVRRIVKDAIAQGWTVTVDYGPLEGGKPVENSRDIRQVMAAVMACDEEYLVLERGGERGWVLLVYGNSGWDVVNDYTCKLDYLMRGADALADRLEVRQ